MEKGTTTTSGRVFDDESLTTAIYFRDPPEILNSKKQQTIKQRRFREIY